MVVSSFCHGRKSAFIVFRSQSVAYHKFHPSPDVERGWLRKFHLSRICRSISRIIKRAGTTHATSSIIKSGQKDTERSIEVSGSSSYGTGRGTIQKCFPMNGSLLLLIYAIETIL